MPTPEEFKAPARSDYPETWFHVIGGNFAKEGLAADVKAFAGVRVNGKPVRRLWAPPYRCDLTPYVKTGVNEVRVDVTSTWRNRLIYDASLPEAGRRIWTIAAPVKDAPLESYGLLGPIKALVSFTAIFIRS